MSNKKLIRKQFRETVFNRDGYRCRKCGMAGKDRQGGDGWKKFHKQMPAIDLDSHHIQDRTLFENQGYTEKNGISVCETCHLKAEEYHQTGGKTVEPGFHPDELYELIGSSYEEAVLADAKLTS